MEQYRTMRKPVTLATVRTYAMAKLTVQDDELFYWPHGIEGGRSNNMQHGNMHLYILADIPITQDSVVYHKSGYVSRVNGFNMDAVYLEDAQRWKRDCTRVVATTDPTWGLPLPADVFMEWVVSRINQSMSTDGLSVDIVPTTDQVLTEGGRVKIYYEDPGSSEKMYTARDVRKILHESLEVTTGKDARIRAFMSVQLDKWFNENYGT